MSGFVAFFRELRRRKVLRVAAMYVLVAWGLIEAASVLAPELELPDWTLRLLIVLATFGLPLALMLAWVFDLTPHGLERTDPVPPARDASARRKPRRDGEHSLAVLPFYNIGGDAQDEYFCDGLAEDLLNRLSRVAGLRVVARSSAFAFREPAADVRAVGDALGVTHVLEGSVRRADKRVRVSVRLVQAEDGYQLWSETYDRELGDTFRIQDEISGAVFDAFNYQFAGPGEARDEHRTEDVEAYHLYLMGRHQFHKRTPETLERAIEYFEQAIALDPRFPLPYTGLADAYALSSTSGEGYGNLPVQEALSRAEPLVQRALELDPDLAEAHASQGLLRRLHDDLEGAEAALRRALALNDAYPLARIWLALTLTEQCRVRDANAELRKALEIDPLSNIVITNLAFDQLRFGQPQEARTLFRRVLDLDPAFPVPCVGLAQVERRLGNAEGAIHWLERATELSPRRAFYRALLGQLRVELGQLDLAARDIARAAAIASEEPVVARARIALLIASGEYRAVADYSAQRVQANSTAAARANAALGRLFVDDLQGARALYEQVGPTLGHYVSDAALFGWRFPHGLLYAHVLAHTGEPGRMQTLATAARETLQRVRAEGVVNPEIDYLEAAIAALRAQYEEAARALGRAMDGGWPQHWWARHDPMLRQLQHDGRLQTLLP